MRTVCILGGGPAGLSCALWLKNHGFHPVILEKRPRLGGLLGDNFHRNDWLIGHYADTGHTICDKFIRHVELKEIKTLTGAALETIAREEDGFTLTVREADGSCATLPADYLVVASGTSPRATPELHALRDRCPERVIIGAGDTRIQDALAGRTVAVLGGGDNAFENALWLAELGNTLDIHVRGEPRARLDFLRACEEHPRIRLHFHSVCSDFRAEEGGIAFEARGTRHRAEFLLVMFGYTPNTAFLTEAAPWLAPLLDARGFLPVDMQQRTPLPRLYAIGDVTDLQFPCIPTAIAQGSVAAKAIVLDAQRRP